MRKRYTNQHGFGLIEIMLVVFVLGIVALLSVPVFSGGGDAEPIMEQANEDGAQLNASLVESAAALAYATESGYTKKEVYALGELVVMGYLNAELSAAQSAEIVTHTGNGNFTYTIRE